MLCPGACTRWWFAEQKTGEFRDLLGLAKSAQGSLRTDATDLLITEDVSHFRFDQPGRDAIDANAVRGKCIRTTPRQSNHARFGR